MMVSRFLPGISVIAARLGLCAAAPRSKERVLIPRYTRKEMGRIWSDENRFQKWLDVEIAATETLADAGQVPKEAAARIRDKARINVERGATVEAADPLAARWLHYGLTSNDVVDTAQALLIREASQIIEAALAKFGEVLERRAREFQHTPQIGRTHGIHAEPITFGLKIANWYAENRRNQERFRAGRGQRDGGEKPGRPGADDRHVNAEFIVARHAAAAFA